MENICKAEEAKLLGKAFMQTLVDGKGKSCALGAEIFAKQILEIEKSENC